ncbi:MAG: flagellar hook-length control protein FliK [Lachnospiraceae bacterium]|nr:flagellar hook-length control protein FliK [Lachnospiraceae bacterium]
MDTTEYMAGIGEIFLNSIKNVTETPASNVSGEGYSQLASMKNGDTFTAKVVRNNGSDVTLKLSGGNLINAKLGSEMSITEGQNVTFQVRNNASSISISPLLTNTATDVSVLKALDQASLPVTDTSTAMVTEMMKAGLPIDRASILDMYSGISANPQAPVSDVVDLAKLGLPATPENLENIGNYKNLSYQIDRGMQDIADKTGQALMDMISSGDTKNAAGLMNTLIDTALSHISEIEDPYIEEGMQSGSTAGTDTMQPGNAENASNAIPNEAGNPQEASDPAARALELLKAMQDPGTVEGAKTSGLNEGQAAAVNAENTGAPNGSLQNISFKDAFDQTVTLMRTLTGDGEYQPAGTADLLRDISLFQQKALESGDMSGLKKLLSSDGLKSLTLDVLKNEWSIQPSEVADKEKVELLYRRLNGQLSMLKEGLAAAGAQNTPAFNAVNNMGSNIDFLQQINQMYAYIQLPLKLSGGDSAHGDLYVFSNKKNMTSNDSVVTAFLHLDMDNLGPVDVYVSMDIKAGGKVSTSFTVADDETLDLLNDHMDQLTERLKGRGYDLKCSMKLKDDDTEPEADALKEGGVNLLLVHAGGPGGSYSSGMRSFDVRA